MPANSASDSGGLATLRPPEAPLSLRRYFAGLAAVYFAAAAIGSLTPLRFTPLAADLWPTLRARLADSWSHDGISIADLAANVALFVPLGFLASAARLSGASLRQRVIRSGLLIVAAGLLSLALECLQLFIPLRNVSLVDVMAETAGAAMGCALWWIVGRRLNIQLARHIAVDAEQRRWNWLLQLYLVAVSFWWLWPLDLSCRPGELRQKFRDDDIVLKPFGDVSAERLAGAGTALLAFLPVGVLIATAGRAALNPRSQSECQGAIFGLTAILSAGQILVLSRRSDVLEFGAVAIGMALGASAAGLHRLSRTSQHRMETKVERRLTSLPVDLEPSWHKWLTWGYVLIVILATAAFLGHARLAQPGQLGINGRTIPNWQPPLAIQVYWATSLLSLALVPRIPIIAALVFAVLGYGVFTPGDIGGGYFRALAGLDLLLVLATLGVAIAYFRSRQQRPSLWIPGFMSAYAVWTVFSGVYHHVRGAPFNPAAVTQCFRLFDGALVVWMAAFAIRARWESYVLALVLAGEIVLSGLLFPDGIYRNHVLATFCAVVAPLLVYCFTAAPHVALQVPIGLTGLHLVWFLYAGESRSAVGGALAGLGTYALLSRYRVIWIAMAAIAVPVVTWLGSETFLVQRFRAVWLLEPGWDTGRIEIWQSAWQAFQRQPLLGAGPGFGSLASEDVHNSYLAVLAQTGAIGLILYLAVWLATIVVLAKAIYRGRRQGDWYAPLAASLLASTMTQLVAGLGYSLHGLQLAFLVAGWSTALLHVSDRLQEP